MTFSEKLLYVRALLKLSQTELAKKLNVSYATLSRWESCKVKPSKRAEVMFEIFCKTNEIKF